MTGKDASWGVVQSGVVASNGTVLTDADFLSATNFVSAKDFNKPAQTTLEPETPRQMAAARAETQARLERLEKVRDVLASRIEQEKSALPKTGAIEIVEPAEAQSSERPSVLQRIGRASASDSERSARINVQPDLSDAKTPGPARSSNSYDPYFIQTEFEKIRSKSVLNKVIEKLKLDEVWANKQGSAEKLKPNETYERLSKSLEIRTVPNTGLIDIQVKSDTPDEAARIANTIAEVYRDSRKEVAQRETQALQNQLAGQEQQITSAKEQLAGLRLAEEQALARSRAQTNTEPADVPPPRAVIPAPIPQPEVQTRDNAFSTFSLNVSDVSFKLAAASLEKGVMPEPANVRSEEFINAFDYRDPEPPPGVPIAFAWERARYPFAHNRDVLRFSIKTAAAGRQAGRPLNLVLLLDNSGSMERADRVQIIHEALRVLAAQLQPQDKLSVVTFARTARLWVDGVPGSQAGEVAEQISGLTPQGGTNLEEAMNLAYQTALRHYLAGGLNRVVLLTDGA
ncbi:MAG TPA: von Willebrand factor type A domain-containing protein, partial [Verrucomicrobiae bacterium]|nr:von Willebrand factor type A domain-containing protein [Verrucomicrobiae bacterium]